MGDSFIRVLLVEDNPGDACLVGEMLAKAKGVSFSLECADYLSKGMARVSAEKFDVVLLDLTLHDSSGYETFEKMSAAAPELPIVVMSGLDDESLAVKAVREGAQDYLVKGQTDANLLSRAIRYAIERKESQLKIKMLQGLLPICAYCKKIRDDSGYWNSLEKYITDHSEAVFSHSICPDCVKRNFPDFSKRAIR